VNLKIILKKNEETLAADMLPIGATGVCTSSGLNNGNVLYKAKRDWIVSLTNPFSTWIYRYPSLEVEKVTLDAFVTSMQVALWTEVSSDAYKNSCQMNVGDFGILCDKSARHGAFMVMAYGGICQLSKGGSLVSRTDKFDKILPISMELTEVAP